MAAVWWGLSALAGCAALFVGAAVRFIMAAERMSEYNDWCAFVDEGLDGEGW